MQQWNNIYKKEGSDYEYYNILKPHKDIPKVANFFKKNNVKKVLDIGCGAGRNLIFLAQKGFVVSGIDYAPGGIAFARKELRKMKLKANLAVGDVLGALPYKDNSFDAVIGVQVLHHGGEKDIKRMINEIGRVLKPKGCLFITLPVGLLEEK